MLLGGCSWFKMASGMHAHDLYWCATQLLVLDGMPFPLKEADHKVQSVWGIDRYTRRWAGFL